MKNLKIFLAVAALCVGATHSLLAMQTGKTRREAMQAHHQALKSARWESRLLAKLVSAQQQKAIAQAPATPCALQEAFRNAARQMSGDVDRAQSRQLDLFEQLQHQATHNTSHMSHKTTHTAHTNRKLAYMLLACLLIQSAHGAILDGQLTKVADLSEQIKQVCHEIESKFPGAGICATILTNTGIGALCGGAPGALAGAGITIAGEAAIKAINNFIHDIAGPEWEAKIAQYAGKVSQGINRVGAKGLMALDNLSSTIKIL